jgi:hypothetical protein
VLPRCKAAPVLRCRRNTGEDTLPDLGGVSIGSLQALQPSTACCRCRLPLLPRESLRGWRRCALVQCMATCGQSTAQRWLSSRARSCAIREAALLLLLNHWWDWLA